MKRILAVDPGTRRCGVAMSNRDHTMAFPRPALESGPDLVVQIGELIESEDVGQLIVGRPLSLAGRETDSTRDADELFESLRRELTSVNVLQYDERLTTVTAQRSLREAGVRAKAQREHIDSAAAVVMLQSFLDGRQRA